MKPEKLRICRWSTFLVRVNLDDYFTMASFSFLLNGILLNIQDIVLDGYF